MISQEIEEFLINVFDLVNVKDCSITKLTDGLSGAAVYILEIKNSRNKSCCGIYILKIIDTLAQWHDRNNNEVDKSKEIYSNAINFQKHLVKVIADSSVRGDDGEYHNLKTFRGKIYRLEGTAKGIIKLDGLDDIIVTFIPSFMVGDQRMEFTRVDISSNVEFNLMFTYSGYKAWNPRKVL